MPNVQPGKPFSGIMNATLTAGQTNEQMRDNEKPSFPVRGWMVGVIMLVCAAAFFIVTFAGGGMLWGAAAAAVLAIASSLILRLAARVSRKR